MAKYLIWIVFWALICSVYTYAHLDLVAACIAFIICFSVSVLPVLACPGEKKGYNDDNKNAKHQEMASQTKMAIRIKQPQTTQPKTTGHRSD